MSKRFEGQFRGHDQSELFFQTWLGSDPRGTIVVTHGMAEHSECYHPVAKQLAADGWEIYAWDMRGHGRSEGKRGYARDVSELLKDLELFVQLVRRQRQAQNGPLLLLGHSLGGHLSLRYLIDGDAQGIAAAVLSSPAMGVAIQVPAWKEKAGRMLAQFLPTATLFNEIKYTDLSRDEEMLKHYASDTLRHDKIAPVLFFSMRESFQYVFDHADKIQIPVLMLLAGDDRIVNLSESQRLFEMLKNKKNQMHIYPESLHEVFCDLDRELVVADMKRFINQFLGSNS